VIRSVWAQSAQRPANVLAEEEVFVFTIVL